MILIHTDIHMHVYVILIHIHIQTHAHIYTHICMCICVSVCLPVWMLKLQFVNFPQVMGFLFNLESRWILQGKSLPSRSQNFSTGTGEKEKDLEQLLYFKAMSPGKSQTSKGTFTSILREKSWVSSHSEDSDALNMVWEVWRMGLCMDHQCHPLPSTPLGTEGFKNNWR